MHSYSYKEETFKAWTELLLLLEYSTLVKDELVEVYTLQKQKYCSQRALQECKTSFHFEDMHVFIDSNIYREIRYKWQEAIINAYKFLQYARSRGGTYGHKVGSLYAFLTTNFEAHQLQLLELEKMTP